MLVNIIITMTLAGHEEMWERACFYTVQTCVYNGTSQETRRVEDKFKMLRSPQRVVIQTLSTYRGMQPYHLVPKEGLAVPREDGRDGTVGPRLCSNPWALPDQNLPWGA